MPNYTVDLSHYLGHSFWIRAATTTPANCISDATIQLLGCWQSDSFICYVRPP